MRELIHGDLIEAPSLGDLRCMEGAWLGLEEGRLQGIWQARPSGWEEARVTDLGHALILQGCCDLHLHAPQYPMLGTGMDLPLLDWLDTYTFPAEARFADTGYARRVYHALAEELLDRGTTRGVFFSSLHTDATLILMEELEAAGITAYVGKVNMDRNGGADLQETTEMSQRETLRWLEACEGFQRVKPILTPRFTPSCTDELMAWLGRLGEERGLRVQSHLSENRQEVAWVRELCPSCGEYWESYRQAGLWKNFTLMAHCVHSTPWEQAAMKEAGVWAVHCPWSNLNLQSGTAPVRQLLDQGVQVALGSDIAGGSQLSMLENMRGAVQASKIRSIQFGEAPLTAAEAYYLGTSAGAEWFGARPGFGLGEPLHAMAVEDASLDPAGERPSLPQRLERLLYRGDRARQAALWAAGRRVR